MRTQTPIHLLFLPILLSAAVAGRQSEIEVKGGPESVVWAVQLSDLHFSVFHPERAADFRTLIAPILATVNPSLVLITGDLTDGKSKDLLTMKQNEREWSEYQSVMADVIARSGLDKQIFYDLRGNHDNFGVPEVGGAYDFYSKYGVNGGAKHENVHSITLKDNRGRKYLFVGFDSTKKIGFRGPTNLFGHISDQLLADIDLELSELDSDLKNPAASKISFGHFPLSFSTLSESGRSLKDIFLKHSLSAYVCGHLHSRFGKNLKRHYIVGDHIPPSGDLYQLNVHQAAVLSGGGNGDCSNKSHPLKEFWEWEMGDWRKSRSVRVLAIDAGYVSYLDIDLKFGSKKTIILPTFPLDSRFMQRTSFNHGYNCKSFETSSIDKVRALVFSKLKMYAVSVKVYDSRSGNLDLVLDTIMEKQTGNETRGDLYMARWNWRAFVDPNPLRYWMQIEAVDYTGSSTLSELRPFSINGLTAKADWKWMEFRVMGLHWPSVSRMVLQIVLPLLFSLLLIPRTFLVLTDMWNTSSFFRPGLERMNIAIFLTRLFWILLELSKLTTVWVSTIVYLLYLTFFPWFYGNIFSETGHLGYMTLKGWVVTMPNGERSYLEVPDVMVIILPHLCLVVLPTILLMSAIAAEKAAYRIFSSSNKKQDDHQKKNRSHNVGSRWIRKFLMLACLMIFWKHYEQCRVIVKAYEMNPLTRMPVYSFGLPLLLCYTVYTTSTISPSR